MQRVLYEILRRSSEMSDRHVPKKRKAEETLSIRSDGKFAEETFIRDTRGARPGMNTWANKRKRTDDWNVSRLRRMYDGMDMYQLG